MSARVRTVVVTPAVVRAGLLGGVASASGIALTATSGWLIVRAAQMPQILSLLVAIVAVRTFGMARPVFRYWERLVSHDAALADLADRRARLYADLVPLTPARLGRRGRADLLTGVVDDLTEVTEASARVTVPVLAAGVAGGLATILTAWLHPVSGLVLLAMLLAAALVVLLSVRLESAAQDDLGAARAEVSRVAALVADHAGELQAVGGTETAMSWVEDAHARVRAATSRQARGRALCAALVLVVTGAATLTAAWVSSRSGLPDPVRALLVLTPVVTGEVIGVLTDAPRAYARARASARRLEGLLAQDPAVVDGGGAAFEIDDVPTVTTRDLTASWTGARPHLGPLDLDLAPGDHVHVSGPNGSGKSTLLAVLARHLDPTGGTLAADGTDLTGVPLADGRALRTLVDDEPHVFASTLRENLRLAAPIDGEGSDPDDATLVRALRRAGLGAWFDGLADGLDTRLGATGRSVSGGERARLAIARALLSRRPLVLLDEPVAHLDTPTGAAVLQDLLESAEGRTVVMVSHHDVGTDGFDRSVVLSPPKEP